MTIVIISITPKDSLTIDSNRQEENGLKLQRRNYTDIAGFLPGFFVSNPLNYTSDLQAKLVLQLHDGGRGSLENPPPPPKYFRSYKF